MGEFGLDASGSREGELAGNVLSDFIKCDELFERLRILGS
jgi:hypothetical protein